VGSEACPGASRAVARRARPSSSSPTWQAASAKHPDRGPRQADITASAYASTLRLRRRLLRDTSRASTSQGIVRRAANLSPSMTDVPKDTPRSTEIDRGLREAGCVHLAGCARFERALPKPDPLEHLLSQNRPDAGWRGRHRSFAVAMEETSMLRARLRWGKPPCSRPSRLPDCDTTAPPRKP
jgi:hypothetical protein